MTGTATTLSGRRLARRSFIIFGVSALAMTVVSSLAFHALLFLIAVVASALFGIHASMKGRQLSTGERSTLCQILALDTGVLIGWLAAGFVWFMIMMICLVAIIGVVIHLLIKRA